ncbi:hypothetical protein EZJ43_04120 [Pedobacter changchengzhani]|uniref:PH domain-containing protein n=1 Tax=Pedobacter changchengzhani TaxID=2529274 RepID=A0A4R5MNC0_9SPHI|nr:STM3941 family protein [Pedobacter changchengzhani]TDG37311.1 hypothetical protein EZJ43_04120 [Pedobacter changchengzhani]
MMDTNDIIIEYDVAKRKKILLLPIAIIAFSTIMLVIILNAERVKIYYLAMFALLILGSIYGIFVLVKSIFSTDQVGLKLTDKTIKFNGTLAGKTIGVVNLKDVESINTSVQYSTKQIYLKLKNPDQYIFQKSKIEMANHGFFINSTELKISFEELDKLLRDYLQKYGSLGIEQIRTI